MHTWRYPLILTLAAGVIAAVVFLPYRSEQVRRYDGEMVSVIAPDRLHHTADVWDYLQLGRQIAGGEGLTSLTTYVPLLPESAAPGAPESPEWRGERPETFPLLWRAPGYPLLVAAAFRLARSDDPSAIIPIQWLAVVLLALATFALARCVLTPGWASLAALWTVCSPLALGVHDPLVATTLHAGAMAFVFRLTLRASTTRSAVVAGAAFAAVVYLRLETLLLVPAALAMFWWGTQHHRGVRISWFLATIAIVTLPWFVRTALLTGDPFYNASSLIFHDTPEFPGWSSSQTLNVRETGVVAFIASNPGVVLLKSVGNVARFARDLVQLPNVALVPFFWFGLWMCRRASHLRRVGYATLIATLGLCAVLAPLDYAARFLASLVPLFCVVAAVGMSQSGRSNRVFAAVASVVVVVTLVWSLRHTVTEGSARVAIEEIASLHLNEEGGAVLLTDAPEIAAWVWRRPSIWSPLPGDVARVREYVGPVLGVFTCAGPNEGRIAGYRSVGGVVSGECPAVIRFPRLATTPLQETQ